MNLSLRFSLPSVLCCVLLACNPPTAKTVSSPPGPDVEMSELAVAPEQPSLPRIITLGEDYADETIQLYNADGTLWHAFSYTYDDSDGEYEYYNAAFTPLAFHPDYYLLAMLCTKENDEYYFVQVDAAGTVKLMPKNAPVNMMSLADYFGGRASVAVVEALRSVGDASEKPVAPGTYSVISTSGNTVLLRSEDGDAVRVEIYAEGKVKLQPLLD